MTIADGTMYDRPEDNDTGVRWEQDAGTVRIVICGTLTDAASAAAQEMLLDACGLNVESVVLALQSEVRVAEYDALRHLVDVAQRLCWAASCRFDVAASDPDACELLAAAGIWPSDPASGEAADRSCD